MTKEYIASLSGGKDSMALIDRLIEEGRPLTKVVNYDTGMEFQAVYRNIEKISKKVEAYGAEMVYLKADTDFLTDMLLCPVKEKNGEIHYGYEWCGRCTRWETSKKVQTINNYLKSIGEYEQYVGIALDEPERVKYENSKSYPLVEWEMTEKQCLEYCYKKGYDWLEEGIELYSILDRVSCWCCGNKNLKELRNMYHYLPKYWGLLKGLQSRIDRPFYAGKYTIFELEQRFKKEDAQMNLFRDYVL